MQMSEPMHAPRSTTQTLLITGGLGGVLFVVTFMVLGALARDYNPFRETISALEFTPFSMAQRINFLVFGLLLGAFAIGLRRELDHGRGARLIPAFQLLSGIGVIGDGLFIHEPLHLLFDLIAFNATPRGPCGRCYWYVSFSRARVCTCDRARAKYSRRSMHRDHGTGVCSTALKGVSLLERTQTADCGMYESSHRKDAFQNGNGLTTTMF
jgi:hypothetical protein